MRRGDTRRKLYAYVHMDGVFRRRPFGIQIAANRVDVRCLCAWCDYHVCKEVGEAYNWAFGQFEIFYPGFLEQWQAVRPPKPVGFQGKYEHSFEHSEQFMEFARTRTKDEARTTVREAVDFLESLLVWRRWLHTSAAGYGTALVEPRRREGHLGEAHFKASERCLVHLVGLRGALTFLFIFKVFLKGGGR